MWHEKFLSSVNHTCDLICFICNGTTSDFRRGRSGKNSPEQASRIAEQLDGNTEMKTTNKRTVLKIKVLSSKLLRPWCQNVRVVSTNIHRYCCKTRERNKY